VGEFEVTIGEIDSDFEQFDLLFTTDWDNRTPLEE
jgi:hypothetical protein